MAQKEKLFASFSSGKTSAFMVMELLKYFSDEYEIVVAFSNTGKEVEKSLIFVNECDKLLGFNTVWIESVVHQDERKSSTHRVVSFETASRKGEPFEEVIKKYGIPNQAYPHCTRELKARPLHSYIRNELGWENYKTAIGMRADELRRIPKDWRELNYWYPLADWGITKNDINEFWDKMPFTLNIDPWEGNCDFCWKKILGKLSKIEKKNPERSVWWAQIESKYGYFTPKGRKNPSPPYFFGRNNTSILQIRELIAKGIIPEISEDTTAAFKHAFKNIYPNDPIPEITAEIQGSLDKIKKEHPIDPSADEEFGCAESCEPF